MQRDIHRMLRIVHGAFGYRPTDSYADKCAAVRRRIQQLKSRGFGGIVTNVAFENYMQDADEWRLLGEKVRVCREEGMRMWLYDENGYPSGAAGTQTLDTDPDFEARAAVMVSRVLAPGEQAQIALPRGHEKLLAAVCYPMAGPRITDEELQRPLARPQGLPVCFHNDTDAPMLCLAFFEKHMYEGAHAQHNVFSSRRYIDVSNPDAVAAFIDNTYRRYTAAVGENYAAHIGDEREEAVIEAIFTDEPSYMGCYLNAGLYPPHIDHPYDDELPLYPVVNWGRDVSARFAARWGYPLEEQMSALFLGHGEAFCRVRHHYHEIMSELYEEAFFSQIAAYCSGVGLAFSGHILLEDELPLHVIYEGNYFQLLRHMHIPGIDMLQSTPQTVWDFAFTPLLVRSIAQWNGRQHVMDEVSAHAQGGRVSEAQRTTALLLQLAFGADVFTSYYPESENAADDRRLLDTLAAATAAIEGERLADAVVVYPIQTMMRHRRPPADICEADSDSEAHVQQCNEAMLAVQFALLDHQATFLYADAATLLAAKALPAKTVILPACDVTPELAAAAAHAAVSGARIVWYCPPQARALFGAQAAALPQGTLTAADVPQLLAALCAWSPRLHALQGDTAGIACARTQHCVLLVNREDAPRTLCWHGALARAVDPAAGELICKAGDEGTVFTLAAGGAALLWPAPAARP